MLAAWVGGYHLNRGHNTCTRETLAQVYNPMFHALPSTPGAWAAAPALEREWPLTPGDLLLIKRQHDALTLDASPHREALSRLAYGLAHGG